MKHVDWGVLFCILIDEQFAVKTIDSCGKFIQFISTAFISTIDEQILINLICTNNFDVFSVGGTAVVVIHFMN